MTLGLLASIANIFQQRYETEVSWIWASIEFSTSSSNVKDEALEKDPYRVHSYIVSETTKMKEIEKVMA